MSQPLTFELNFAKQTKNTFVYTSEDEDAPVTSLYVSKESLSTPPPASITVTITPDP